MPRVVSLVVGYDVVRAQILMMIGSKKKFIRVLKNKKKVKKSKKGVTEAI